MMRILLTHHPYITVILLVVLSGLTFDQTNIPITPSSVHINGEQVSVHNNLSLTLARNTSTLEYIAQVETPTPDTEVGPTPTPATEAERQRNQGRIRPDPLPVWMAGFGALAVVAALFVAVQHSRRR
ncbi:MAG: hypothetical protein AAGF95_15985 [Chloroflexota bacterium]